MRPTTFATLLALAATSTVGCDKGVTQPSGRDQQDAQNAGQKQADDDERQNQAEGKKMMAVKKK